MKKFFKLMSFALVACTISMFVACEPGVETFKIKVKANNNDWGTVTGGGNYESGATATLQATANAGYKFVNWDNGSTNNPLLITVVEDAEYIANFEELAGVNVTFGDNNWTAGYVNGQYLSGSNALLLACAQTNNSTSLPQINLQNVFSGEVVGTFQGSSEIGSGNVSFSGAQVWYYENQDDFITINYSDGSSVNAGDWWDKTMTLNVTAFDATTLNISLVANATMGHVNDVLEGATWANATERQLTVNVVNQTLTSSKKAFVKKEIVKISKY